MGAPPHRQTLMPTVSHCFWPSGPRSTGTIGAYPLTSILPTTQRTGLLCCVLSTLPAGIPFHAPLISPLCQPHVSITSPSYPPHVPLIFRRPNLQLCIMAGSDMLPMKAVLVAVPATALACLLWNYMTADVKRSDGDRGLFSPPPAFRGGERSSAWICLNLFLTTRHHLRHETFPL